MKNLLITSTVLLLLGISGCKNDEKENNHATTPNDSIAVAVPAEGGAEEHAAPPDSAAMAKAWEAYMMPGPMHKWMASADGKWEAEVRTCTSPGGPLGEPEQAKVENKMILNGLYQESTYKGKMMGMDFEGKGLMGYDNARKKFMSTWIDNMGSGILQMEGDYDENTKTLNLSGKASDPATGKQTDFREVVKVVDDKTQVMEMYSTVDGKEFRMMEIRLAKK